MNHHPKRGLCAKTFERRERLLAALKDGRRVRSDKLRAAVMPGRSQSAFASLIRGMRADGYQIEGEQKGTASRGYRLITELGAK